MNTWVVSNVLIGSFLPRWQGRVTFCWNGGKPWENRRRTTSVTTSRNKGKRVVWRAKIFTRNHLSWSRKFKERARLISSILYVSTFVWNWLLSFHIFNRKKQKKNTCFRKTFHKWRKKEKLRKYEKWRFITVKQDLGISHQKASWEQCWDYEHSVARYR